MVVLEGGEAALRSGKVVFFGQGTSGGSHPGTLTITNHALIFEGPIPKPAHPERPPGQRGPFTVEPGVLRVPLWRCKNASLAPSGFGGNLDVELLQRHLFFQVDDVTAWAQTINSARVAAPPPPPGVTGRGGGPGRGPAMPRCQYCGNLSPAGSPRCASCGAPF